MTKDIILSILHTRVEELLKTINSKYPEQFKKEYIILELNLIMDSIKDNTIINIQLPTIPRLKVIPTIEVKLKHEKHEKKKTQKPISSDKRCNARIWNSIYDKTNNKEVADIDKKFKITDFNELKIKEFITRYSIGKQCCRKKKADSEYCFQHLRHNPHGDYFKEPPNWLCFHYMKDGNYLE
jgi:hypothetical protein